MKTWNSELETHLQLTSGWLCLDFVNTNDMHAADHPTELIHNYLEMLEWSETRNIFKSEQVVSLLNLASNSPDESNLIHKSSIELREYLYTIFHNWYLFVKENIEFFINT